MDEIPHVSPSLEKLFSDDSAYERLIGISLTPRGFLVLKCSENQWFCKRAMKDLTYEKPTNRYVSKFAKKEPPLRVYLQDQSYLLIPKFYGVQMFRGKNVPIENKNVDGLPMSPDAVYRDDRPLFETERQPQVSATSYAIKMINKSGGALLVMPVGTGKTNCGLYVAFSFKRKVFWLVHRKNLLEQAADRCREFIPNARIGYLYGSVCDIDDKDIVFGTIQSLGTKHYDKNIIRQFGTIVLDEAHHAAAPVFVEALWQVAAPRMLALTANPIRKDGMTEILYHFFSRNAFKVKPKLPSGIPLHIHVYKFLARSATLEPDLCDAAFRRKHLQTLDAIERKYNVSSDEAFDIWKSSVLDSPDDVSNKGYSAVCGATSKIACRNNLICTIVKKALLTKSADELTEVTLDEMNNPDLLAIDQSRSCVCVGIGDEVKPIDTLTRDEIRSGMKQVERQCIVVTMNKNHVRSLKKRLIRSGVPGHAIGIYYGDTKEDQRPIELSKRVIICTYAMAEEGLDVPTANTLIDAAPRGESAEQTIGRVMRDKMSAAVPPTVFTIVDQWCDMASGMYWKRVPHYKAYKPKFRLWEIGEDDERFSCVGELSEFPRTVSEPQKFVDSSYRKQLEKRQRSAERQRKKQMKRVAHVQEFQ